MRALTTLPSYADLRASIARDRADRMTARTIAFLVDTVAQYGVGRQWEMLLPSGVACAVFTDEGTARALVGDAAMSYTEERQLRIRSGACSREVALTTLSSRRLPTSRRNALSFSNA